MSDWIVYILMEMRVLIYYYYYYFCWNNWRIDDLVGTSIGALELIRWFRHTTGNSSAANLLVMTVERARGLCKTTWRLLASSCNAFCSFYDPLSLRNIYFDSWQVVKLRYPYGTVCSNSLHSK